MDVPSAYDPALEKRVAELVRVRTRGLIHDLHVEVVEDQIVLSGRTSAYYYKQLATRAAFEAGENLDLRNEIKVG